MSTIIEQLIDECSRLLNIELHNQKRNKPNHGSQIDDNGISYTPQRVSITMVYLKLVVIDKTGRSILYTGVFIKFRRFKMLP